MATAEEKGVDWEYHHIDFKTKQHKSAEFLKLQPFGKVPVLKEGDFVCYESRAIMKYLASKPGGTALIPSDAQEAALMEQCMSVEYSYFSPAFMPIYFERMLKPSKGLGVTDEAVCAKAIKDLEPVLDQLEVMLAGKEYFCNGSFTLADLTFLCYFENFEKLKIGDLLAKRANLSAWWARCSARPACVSSVNFESIAERRSRISFLTRTHRPGGSSPRAARPSKRPLREASTCKVRGASASLGGVSTSLLMKRTQA